MELVTAPVMPPMKPFVDVTGPEKVVDAMMIPHMRYGVSVCMSSAGTVRYTGDPGLTQI